MRKLAITSAALALFLVAACNGDPDAKWDGPPHAAARAALARAPATPASPPLQAAEPFEALTGTAFSAAPPGPVDELATSFSDWPVP
ncbi:MAG: hypothetical protein QOH81_2273 [Sphingomonadales bacterium]|jgi:hypothetical protein|nr:hypothetical protein [Sphingomonadales bacterium]